MQPLQTTLSAALFALLPLTSPAQTKGATVTSPADPNAATVHRLYEEALNQNRLDLLPELVSPNVINHTYAGDKVGLADFTQAVQATRRMYSNQHFTVDGVIAKDDQAAAHWTMTGINSGPIAGIPAINKPVTQHGVVFYRFENGKIAEVWLQIDRLGILQQIGVEIPGSATALHTR